MPKAWKDLIFNGSHSSRSAEMTGDKLTFLSSNFAAKLMELQTETCLSLHLTALQCFHCGHFHKDPSVYHCFSVPPPNNTAAQNHNLMNNFLLLAFVFHCFCPSLSSCLPPALSYSVESWGLSSPSPQREPSVSQARTPSTQQLTGGRLSVCGCLSRKNAMSMPC